MLRRTSLPLSFSFVPYIYLNTVRIRSLAQGKKSRVPLLRARRHCAYSSCESSRTGKCASIGTVMRVMELLRTVVAQEMLRMLCRRNVFPPSFGFQMYEEMDERVK